MTRNQTILVLLMAILFCLIYFFGKTKSSEQQTLEKSRSENIESTGIQNLLTEAKTSISAAQIQTINAITLDIDDTEIDSLKVPKLEQLSSTWYSYGFPSIAGFYAEKIAEINKNETSWNMAGTTYGICVKSSEDQKVKEFCSKRAVKAFENAISFNPENVDSKINLAISFVDNPPQDNPMKGILMLVDLSKKYPDNPGVSRQLGRLAIQTGQYQKAVERLLQSLALDGENRETNCLLVQAYEALNDMPNAERYKIKCN
jgi:tetratricopeptide (TPR) repeat protein